MPGTLAKFPYVNGAIFAEQLDPEYFDYAMREALLNACDFDWSKIDVSVFGSLFQLVKSKEARRGDGEHYTSKTNILKTIGPLFLDELRAQADKLVSNPATPVRKLEEFRDSLAAHIFCDPFIMRETSCSPPIKNCAVLKRTLSWLSVSAVARRVCR